MNRNLYNLANGRSPIYIATRLFDNSGRYFGAKLEEGCVKGILKYFKEQSIIPKKNLTYLPFRDSNETVIPMTGESFTKAIYRIDKDVLSHSFALLAPVNDICQDSGISYEIGLAAAWKIPILIFDANFFRWVQGEKEYSVEPIYTFFTHEIIEAAPFTLTDKEKIPRSYLNKLNKEFEIIGNQISEATFRLCENISVFESQSLEIPAHDQNNSSHIYVFLEFGGGQYDFQDYFAKIVKKELEDLKLDVKISMRHSNKEYRKGVLSDIKFLKQADIAVFLGDGTDVDPETAFLLGFASALNLTTILYHSGKRFIHSSPEYHTPRNLMISESVNEIVTDISELKKAIDKFYSE